MRSAVITMIFTLVLAATAAAAAELPPEDPGVSVFVPILDNAALVLDGDLSDWSTVPLITTTTGPIPAADPSNTGSVSWRVAATSEALHFSATVVDSTIVAGQHGDEYWNEDSIEFYVNFSGDQDTSNYGPGVAQITLSPVDIGATDPSALTISGNNAAGLAVSGFVFATADGWGVEMSLGLDGLTSPVHLQRFGLQMQANGSSGGDRDTKLSWSEADVSDTSFNDPGVFGTGVFFDESIEAAEAVVTQGADDPVETVTPVPDANDDPGPDVAANLDDTGDLIADDEATVAEPDGNRSLLIAAVVSAVTIVVGALWFERRRKAYEARLARVPAYAELEIVDDEGDS